MRAEMAGKRRRATGETLTTEEFWPHSWKAGEFQVLDVWGLGDAETARRAMS